jgi:hypothetical protein
MRMSLRVAAWLTEARDEFLDCAKCGAAVRATERTAWDHLTWHDEEAERQ